MACLRDFIEDNYHRSCADEAGALLLEIENQQDTSLIEIKSVKKRCGLGECNDYPEECLRCNS